MMEELGTVVETDGDHAWVAMERRSACAACATRSGCSGGVLGDLFGRRPVGLRALNRVGARPGERVVVAVAEEAVRAGALAAYAVPLLGLLAGAGAGEALALRLDVLPADAASLAFGAGGLAAGLLWARRRGTGPGRGEGLEPVLTRRASL